MHIFLAVSNGLSGKFCAGNPILDAIGTYLSRGSIRTRLKALRQVTIALIIVFLS